jgi:3-deoxy-manno-octulosonate cytidylyltransferase (CMP-KDO synthetase)
VREPDELAAALWWRHIGVYAYQAEVLQQVAALPPSPLEQLERLEQLRALQAGFTIGVSYLDHPAWPGINTPEELAIANVRWPDFAEAC